MLPKQHRFSARTRLEHPFVLQDLQFTMRIAKNNLELSRFCVVVSKKVDKRAVLRNKIKRLMLKKIQDTIKNIKPGYDILIHMKKNPEDQTENLFDSFEKALLKGRVLI